VINCGAPVFVTILAWLALLIRPLDVCADATIFSQAMKATTITEVFIEEDHIRVDLEIGINDLPAFQNLLPDEFLKQLKIEAKPLEQRMTDFFMKDFVIRGENGDPLLGHVIEIKGQRRVKRDEITGEPLPAGVDEGEAVVFARLVYPLKTMPKSLSMQPPQRKEDKRFTSATIGFVAYHRGLPINDFRFLSQEETIDLDWEDPWFSRFRNKNLWRQYNESINTFLYIEPFEVRVEIIIRPYDLQQWIDLDLNGKTKIPVDAQEELKHKVASFLAPHAVIEVDGKKVSPKLDRIQFLRRTLRSSVVVDPPQALDVYAATLGVIYVHPRRELPQQAKLTWKLFNTKFPQVRAAATDEAGPMEYRLRPDDNELVWNNFLKNPTIPTMAEVMLPPTSNMRWWIGVAWAATVVWGIGILRATRSGFGKWGLIGRLSGVGLVLVLTISITIMGWNSSKLTTEMGEKVVGSLLRNIYRAFDYREEELIYDTLENSVNGDLLTQIYLETRRGLELASQGGARVKVKEVELGSVDFEPDGIDTFRAICVWNVKGSVGHWGHIHQRINQYQAELTIKVVNGVWKITELVLLEENRIS